MMDPTKQPRSTQKTTTIEWVLCSPHFKDLVIIVPKDLNNTSIMSPYLEIPVMQVQKRYFKVECSRTHQVKRRSTKQHTGNSKD